MTDARCRIGTVRYKHAPHLAEIKPRPRGAEIEADMRRHIDTICGYFRESGLAGMAIVAWDFNGGFSRATRTHPDSPVRQTLLPAFVADILRRDTAADVTRDVLSGND